VIQQHSARMPKERKVAMGLTGLLRPWSLSARPPAAN